MRFLIDLELDGYEIEEEMIDACYEFIDEQLNFSASYVKVLGDEKTLDLEINED